MNSTEPLQSDAFEAAVRAHAESILHSSHFDASGRSRDFFRFIVEQALGGHTENLSQAAIAMSVFGRQRDFDAITDPIVRVQAGRLRRSLERYYLLANDSSSIRIGMPKGSYVPEFVDRLAQHTVAELTSEVEIKNISLTEVGADWPTIMIHPFDAGFAQGAGACAQLKEQLTMELCRYGGMRVVRSRDLLRLNLMQQASVRYELRGSIQKSQDDYLIGARLVDRATGEQVWGDEYRTHATASRWSIGMDDVARVIAARIGAEYGVVMRLLARERSARSDMVGPFSAILRCNHFFLSRHSDDLIPTMKALEILVASEPEVSLAWTYLARLYLANHTFELCRVPTPIENTIGYAYQGVCLDPTSIRSRCLLAKALLVKGELEAARDELDQTLRLNPDSLAYRDMIGWLLALAGDWDRGMGLMRDAVERNPFCLPYVKHGLWADYLRRDQYCKAYVAALEYCGPTFFWRDLMGACCLGHLGRLDEAEASVEELLQAKPDFAQRGRTLIGYYIKSADLRERIIDGLGRAGLVLS